MIKSENGNVLIGKDIRDNMSDLELLNISVYQSLLDYDKENDTDMANTCFCEMFDRFNRAIKEYDNTKNNNFCEVYHNLLIREFLDDLKKYFSD